MKNGKIEVGHFQRNDKEPFNAVLLTVCGEGGTVIIQVELTFEQYGKVLSGYGSVDMKYKKYGEK